jgi:Ca2+-binding EF-hand superfamily protein
MKEKGGTAFSIIRKTFLNWDADASGEMSKSEVCGALKMLKMNVSEKEANELVKYYDLEGDGEMRYQPVRQGVRRAVYEERKRRAGRCARSEATS